MLLPFGMQLRPFVVRPKHTVEALAEDGSKYAVAALGFPDKHLGLTSFSPLTEATGAVGVRELPAVGMFA